MLPVDESFPAKTNSAFDALLLVWALLTEEKCVSLSCDEVGLLESASLSCTFACLPDIPLDTQFPVSVVLTVEERVFLADEQGEVRLVGTISVVTVDIPRRALRVGDSSGIKSFDESSGSIDELRNVLLLGDPTVFCCDTLQPFSDD